MGNCWASPAVDDNRSSANFPATPGAAPTNQIVTPTNQIVTPKLKMFTLAELRRATRNFRPDSMLGEGGFGRVFKGWIDEETLAPSRAGVGMAVAVKKSSPDSAQGIKEWKAEVNFLGKFSHPNLVRLIGYCIEDRELLLVYEYMQKGSLEVHLFSRHVEPPPWGIRLKIAMDAAEGLRFLHASENTVIYRDFKASNVLLDVDYTAKLSDFGLARLGPSTGRSHVTTEAVGTYGYAAPEYIATGHLYVKSDVYTFGVVLLEILTGLRAYDVKRPTGQHNLVDSYKPLLPNKSRLKKIVDPRMEEYPEEAALKLAQLILRCLENDPRKRPSMSEVVTILERISTIMMPDKKTARRPSPSKSKAQDHQPTHHLQSPLRGRPGNTGPLPRALWDVGMARH
ncbi:hypothetical protein Nepgr_006510 [Nepenthes gracilis]|uniref:non-specific serine/threonine protein kinase n=1 Tax=Nepenthes gracilis TaxID=150966 RepID=A0AAD3S5L8_NEPGR|nr:hypothetical protein Nepgr_006510 [Nepenthes gracilis]